MGNAQLVEVHGTALAAERRIKELIYVARNSWVRLGVALVRFHDSSCHLQFGMSFDDWVEKRLDFSRETAYRLIKMIKGLEKGVTIEQIEKITKDNCEILVKNVPEPKRYLPEIIEAAQKMSNPSFIQMLKRTNNYWEPATKDPKCQIRIDCQESLKTLWEGAIALAEERGFKDNGRIEDILRTYLTSQEEL